MGKLTPEMKDFIREGRLAYVATSNDQGIPNVAPKGSLGILDDDHLVFADLYSQKTRQNLRENPRVAIAVVNPPAYQGYQFKGKAEILDSGPAFKRAVDNVSSAGLNPAKIKYAVVITIEEVYDLAPGPDSGRRVG